MGDTPNPASGTDNRRGPDHCRAALTAPGKTTVTLGIQRALSRRGLNVQPLQMRARL